MSRNKNFINPNFKHIGISISSPESVLARSYGEVTEASTKNYRTYKSEEGGLFCPRIFGPEESWECACGKYKGIKYRGNVCDRCGVEINDKNVRRERTGHIKLAVPVVHPFFYRYYPNVISTLLDVPAKKLESIIYYATYIVIQPGVKKKEGIERLDILTIKDYYKHIDSIPKNKLLSDNDPQKFIAQIGAEAVSTLLKQVDLKALSAELRKKIDEETSQQRRSQAIKRLKVVESFLESERNGNPSCPEWMVLKYIPVISPEYRPLVVMNNGRFASSDITELLRLLITRNIRCGKIKRMQVPALIELHESRMLQDAVNALYDASTKGDRWKMEGGGRPLKSYANVLTGKTGLLRGNLLAKRVDYSGRSVITVNPLLKLDECGLPKEMALVLFRPYVMRCLKRRGLIKTFKEGNKLIETKQKVIWEVLEIVVKDRLVILNRPPTLHKFNFLAFKVILVEGSSIQINPLVCGAFNADFDGDQMAVHVPLGQEAIAECSLILLSTNNLLSPSNGQPVILPVREMALGVYYMTLGVNPSKEEMKSAIVFSDANEVMSAYHAGKVKKHTYIKVRIPEGGKLRLVETTVGRVMFNQYLPKEIGFVNQTVRSKDLRKIVVETYKKVGVARTVKFLDEIKILGFEQMHEGGLTFAFDDMKTPTLKDKILEEGRKEVQQLGEHCAMGVITENERYNKVVDIWGKANNQLIRILRKELSQDKGGLNSIYMQMDSGARGSVDQVKQMLCWRGQMTQAQKSSDTRGGVIEQPVVASFKDGLSAVEYFAANRGSRVGLAHATLKTADAGYMHRKLTDVAQNVIISEKDCHTLRGRTITPIYSGGQLQTSVGEQLVGRELVKDIVDAKTGEVLFERGVRITKELGEKIDDLSIVSVAVRSSIFCEAAFGVCSRCYGINLGTQKDAAIGDSIGTIAAQSISEPSTQFTLRIFHTGGVVTGANVDENVVCAVEDGSVQLMNLKVLNLKGKQVVVNRGSELKVVSNRSYQEVQNTILPYGAVLFVGDKEEVKKQQPLFEWDPYKIPVLTTVPGRIVFDAIEEGVTYKEEYNEQTGRKEKIIIESQDRYKVPTIVVVDEEGNRTPYMIPVKAHIGVKEGQMVEAGEILAKIPRPKSAPQNIVGGLQRITKLFEMQGTVNQAFIAHIDGRVSIGEQKRAKVEVTVIGKQGVKKTYKIPTSRQLLVQDGDFVKAGNMLCDGVLLARDVLEVWGVDGFCNYMIQQVQDVYRSQGISVADKHLEIILRQMLQKIRVVSSGDTYLIPDQTVTKYVFRKANQTVRNKLLIIKPGDTQFREGELVSPSQLEVENKAVKDSGFQPAGYRQAVPAIGKVKVQGITSAAVDSKSFVASMSFQETIKVVVRSAIAGKIDKLRGIKENIIACKLFPAGTGIKSYENLRVTSKEVEEALAVEKSE